MVSFSSDCRGNGVSDDGLFDVGVLVLFERDDSLLFKSTASCSNLGIVEMGMGC